MQNLLEKKEQKKQLWKQILIEQSSVAQSIQEIKEKIEKNN